MNIKKDKMTLIDVDSLELRRRVESYFSDFQNDNNASYLGLFSLDGSLILNYCSKNEYEPYFTNFFSELIQTVQEFNHIGIQLLNFELNIQTITIKNHQKSEFILIKLIEKNDIIVVSFPSSLEGFGEIFDRFDDLCENMTAI